MRLKSEDYMRKDRMWTYYKRIYNLTRSNGENATGPWWEKTMLAHAKCHLFTKPILHAAAQVKLF
jgi:hypothetical protein